MVWDIGIYIYVWYIHIYIYTYMMYIIIYTILYITHIYIYYRYNRLIIQLIRDFSVGSPWL